jgi:outer membrane protein assembly factor BamB
MTLLFSMVNNYVKRGRRVVKIRKSVFLFAVAILAVLFCLCAQKAYAGKTWSEQAFSEKEGIAVIGNEDKYETVYGISIPEKKILWKIGMPKSRSAHIEIDGDMVILVALEDAGFSSNVKVVDLKTGKVKWEKKLPSAGRKTEVFKDQDTIYFGVDQSYRDIVKAKVFAFNKATGQEKWAPYTVLGNIKGMVPTQAGDYILILEKTGLAKDQKTVETSIELVKIDKNTGKDVWAVPVKGTFASIPTENAGVVYFVTQNIEIVKDSAGKEAVNIIRTFQAVSSDNGQILSTFIFGNKDKPYGDPVYIGSNPVVVTDLGKVICFDSKPADSSKPVKWEFDLGAIPQSNIIVQDQLAIVATMKMEGEQTKVYNIVCLDGSTGQQKWINKVDGLPELPFIVTGDSVIVGIRNVQGVDKNQTFLFKLQGLNILDGKEKWKSEAEGKMENPLFLKDNMLFVMLFGKKDNKTTHIISMYDVAAGTVKWHYTTDSVINTKLFVDDDSVDFGTKDGFVVSLSLPDGTEKYKFNAGSELDTAIADKDKTLGFATQEGEYFIINDAGKLEKAMNLKPWFDMKKISILLGCLLLSAALSWYIYHASKGKEMFVRKIAGLQAIDEAVGRSTEMGKPVLYITGLADVDDIQTLASLSILGHIAQKTAEYDTPLVVPCCRSVVMSTAQEVVKESYLKAGRPDTYRSENIHYLTDDQFGYVAGVDGIMVREKPAANFYMGKFYAESLILAETGHSTGAIQIAGTAEAAQLPFFVAACDYTLIGEELFAASAYLSKDPQQIGSLKGQDMAKAIILAVVAAGCILLTFEMHWVKLLFATQ